MSEILDTIYKEEPCSFQQRRERENALRLALTLKEFAEDKATVKALAYYLRYNESQLAKDMKAVSAYIDRIEKKGD